MDNRRLLVAAILSVAVLFVWQVLFPPPEPPRRPSATSEPAASAGQVAAKATNAPAAVASNGTPETAPEAGADSPVATAPALEPIADAEERRVVLENDAVRAELTNRGAQLLSFRLKDKKLSDGTPLELVAHRTKSPYPLALVGEDGAPHPLDGVLHRVTTDDRPAGKSAFFTYRGSEGDVEKRVTLAADGRLEIELRVAGGLGKGGLVLGPGLRVRALPELDNKIVRRAAVYRYGGKVEVVEARGVEAPTRLPASGLDWIGLQDTYFLTAVVRSEGLGEAKIEPVALEPEGGGADAAAFDAVPFASADLLPEGLKKRPRDLRLVLVPAGETLELTTVWSAKQFDRLEGFGVGLEQTVRWGWLGFLARPLLRALQWIHAHVTPNYGWAIVLLTATLKIALLPLSIASFKSMRKMQKLNPKMQAIRERWRPKLRDKNGRFNPDSQRQMNEEVMALYRSEGVNPAGGCLPILVQLPIFFAFYQLLSTAVELWQSPWQFWIHDLTAPDPYYVLPIVMGLSQIVQQRMTPPPPDPMQKRLMQFLPIVFTVFSLGFASGLVLYWLTNNLLSIAQQTIYNRMQQRTEDEAGTNRFDKPKKKKP